MLGQNYYYFYPALTVDSLNRLNLVFGCSSSNDYPGLVFAGQTNTEHNMLEPTQIFQSGMWYDSTGRYGDYFGAAIDPVNSTYAWVAGEFHSDHSSSWSTEIASTNPLAVPEFSLAVQILLVSMMSAIVFYRYVISKINKKI